MNERIQQIIKQETNAVSNIPVTSSFATAIDIIYDKVQTLGGKLVTSGMGKAGQIALNISTTFSSTGTPAVFLHPSEAQHGDLGLLQKNDVLLLISNSGKTREIIELTSLAKNLIKNIPIIVITSDTNSFLANEADVTILTGAPEEVCTLKLSPTTSTTVMTVIGDILVVLMEERIGFNAMEYSKRHHGGYLGDKSRSNAETDKN